MLRLTLYLLFLPPQSQDQLQNKEADAETELLDGLLSEPTIRFGDLMNGTPQVPILPPSRDTVLNMSFNGDSH